MTQERTPLQQYQALFVIWISMLFSQLMLVFVLYMAKTKLFVVDFSQPFLGSNPTLVAIFLVLAPINLILSFVMKRRAIEESIIRQSVGHVQTGLVVACAFCEAVSLLGVLLAFMIDYTYFFIFIALGALGILLHKPSQTDIINASFKPQIGN